VDSDHQADKAWLLSVHRKLYQWSRQNPEERYRELWNWITEMRCPFCSPIGMNGPFMTFGICFPTVSPGEISGPMVNEAVPA
jgi:hypothetical protein